MDLISRKAVAKKMLYRRDYVGRPSDPDCIIADEPSIPAVPLDKLCEWLANSFSDPPCCTLENVQCKMECRGFTQMDYSECWRYVLTKWMEGLDGTD